MYNGTNWVLQDNYDGVLNLFEANDTYVLSKRSSGVFSTFSSTNLSLAPITIDQSVTENVFDGASNGTSDFLLNQDTLFGTDFAIPPLTAQTPNFDISVSGDFSGIALDGSNDFYISTSSGQIYISSDNGVNWTLVNTISDDIPTENSLQVVTVELTEYLLIGTNNGYYEMEIGTTIISRPSATVSVLDFETSYPELATELVYEVYQSADGVAGDYFYLATSKGLWKRNTDGTFSKQ